MNLFAEIEKTIERGFRKWTDRMLGPAESDEVLLVHREILEAIESKVQTVARGERVFPYSRVTVTLVSGDVDRRALYQTAFGEGGRLEADLRTALESVDCELPRNFTVEVKTAETGEKRFEIAYGLDAPPAKAAVEEPAGTGRLTVVKGKTVLAEYLLEKARTNIGRIAELTDAEQRVVRRNDVVFEEGDEANATVSRRHAHIRFEGGDYRICDDESEYGTRVFRDGRAIEVPAGNRRGERLRSGDEIYLGRACLRFDR
jgi:pSer/pThr/pTyr-binding forkhead associated (FHA) protein